MIGLILLNMHDSKKRSTLKTIVFWVLSLGLLLAFSRMALMSFIALLVILWVKKKNWRQTILLPACITTITLLPLWWARVIDQQDQAIVARKSAAVWAVQLLKDSPALWYGIGIGNYQPALQQHLEFKNIPYQPWEIDFVHSIPLLIFVEWGLFGTALLTIAILWAIRGQTPKKVNFAFILLSPFVVFDHFFFSQTALALYLVTALLLQRSTSK
jgi:hypothetical protein